MSDYELIIVDDPCPLVRRITLNRPEKRNPMNNTIRTEIFDVLDKNDNDDDVRCTIIRGAGETFCAGYDLAANNLEGQPYHTSPGAGNWPRHVVDGWFHMWDLAKPVIAQVHGYCLAGGTELATACDLVYVAEDAKIGYPVVRTMSPPDMQYHPWMMGMRRAMELMLTGDSISGKEAAEWGFANRALPPGELEDYVLDKAERIAKIPTDLQQLNKRSVHRAMEVMGARAAMRSGTEIQALGFTTKSFKSYMESFKQGVTHALNVRDKEFGDYRVGHDKD